MIPENILNEFSSYQVQMNILATYDFDIASTLCNDYVILEQIKNDQDLPKYEQKVNTDSHLHKVMEQIRDNVFIDKFVNENKSLATLLRRSPHPTLGGKVMWLIDTSEDADFLFDSVEFTTYCAPNPKNSNGSPSIGLQLEGEMQITEVATAKFMEVFSALRPTNTTTFKALTLVLAPTVYGFTSQDSQTPHVVPLNPVAFLVTNVTSNFTDQGGKYTISMVGITNGFANLSSQSTVNQSVKLKLSKRMPLREAVEAYQNALNDRFQKYRVEQKLDSSFVDVEYRIKLDPNAEQIPSEVAVDFTDVPYSDDRYLIDNINGYATTLNTSDAILSFKNGSIIDGIQEILKHSTGIIEDSVPKEIKTIKVDKIPSNISTRDVSETEIYDFIQTARNQKEKSAEKWEDLYEPSTGFFISSKPTVISKMSTENNKLILEFTIVKTYVTSSNDPTGANVDGNDFAKKIVESLTTGEDKTTIFKNPIFKNLLYYDYLFTGQNVDVLDYTMNITQGTVFVHSVKWEQALNLGNGGISVAPTNKTGEYIPSLDTNDAAVIGSAGHTISNNYSPGPKQMEGSTKFIHTVANPEITASYYDKLNRYSVTETINQEITVTGNPILWGSFVDSASGTTKTSEKRPIARWDVYPPLMYINIKYPTDPNYFRGTDVSTGYTNTTNETFTPFWYRGLHRIFAIKTIVNGNQFQHIITTFPLVTTKQAEQKIADVLQQEAAAETTEQSDNTTLTGAKSNKTHSDAVLKKLNTGASVTALLPSDAKFTAASGTPLAGTLVLTSGFLPMRRIKRRASAHLAIDLRANVGAPVLSMTSGKVISAVISGDDSYVKILTDKRVVITYLHVTPVVKKDDVVAPNQKIAIIRKFGPNSEYNKEHLHLSITYKGVKYNPEQVLKITQTNNTPDAILHFKEKK